jgi:hypothetical protein
MNMSFALTTEQVRHHTKNVTRRLGWARLKPGQRVQAVVKSQGLKKGEHPEKLCIIECVKNESEELEEIVRRPCRTDVCPECPGSDHGCSDCEVSREGFPNLTPRQFVDLFCQHMKVTPNRVVNRIEFKYVEEVPFR